MCSCSYSLLCLLGDMQFAKDPPWTMQFEQYSRTKDQACIYTVHVHCKRTETVLPF